jgi:hypothetical protein
LASAINSARLLAGGNCATSTIGAVLTSTTGCSSVSTSTS